MRILIVHNTLNDSKSVSGVLRHYAWMAQEWTAAGHPTDFLVARAGFHQLRDLAPGINLISSDNIFDATAYLSKTWRYMPAYAYRVARSHVMRLPHKYDVFYASNHLIMELYPAMVLARRQGAQFVTKIHHILAAEEGRKKSFFDRLFLWTERKCMYWNNRYGALTICGTELMAEVFHAFEARLGLPRRETVQVGYGIDLKNRSETVSDGKIYDGVHLGRLHEHKGVFDLPVIWEAVVRKIPKARLLIIGEGPHRERSQQMFNDRGLGGLVTFAGAVPEADKNKLLAQCRVGISASHEEGWGLSINEFMAASLPVAGFRLPVFDTVFPGQIQLAPLGDSEALAEQTIRLLTDVPLQMELGRNNREFVRRYDYREVAKKELAALKGICPGGR